MKDFIVERRKAFLKAKKKKMKEIYEKEKR